MAQAVAAGLTYLGAARAAGISLEGLGVVGAGTAGAAIGAGYLGYRGTRYLKRKYNEMVNPGTQPSHISADTQMGGYGYAGATNVVQRSFVRSRSGKKLRKTARNAHRLLKASMAYCVERFQRMYAYSGTGTSTDNWKQAYPPFQFIENWNDTAATNALGRLSLGHHTSGTPGNGTQVNVLPGYLFCLNSWSNVSVSARPMFRPYFDASGNLKYYQIKTQNLENSNVQSFDWQPELLRGAILPPSDCQNAFLMWSDIRLALYGAVHCPTRIICEMIQFKKDYFHPGESPTSDEQKEIDMHYINEFKNLVYHPQDVNISNRNSNLKVLMSKQFLIGPDTSSSDDPTQPNILYKIFKRFNRLCNWRWRTTNLDSGINNSIQPNNGELDSSHWQLQSAAALKPVTQHAARIYLYIRAEAMTPVASSTTMNNGEVQKHVPFMDICVRNKWMFESG